MTNSSAVVRALITYGIILPLAILLGYMAGNNSDGISPISFIVTGIIFCILSLPLLLRWHHALLFASWSSAAVVFFLPGRPELWMFMALASFSILLVQRALAPELLMRQVTFILMPLLFIVLVVVGTAYLRGGIHLGSLGGDTLGGRKYLYMIAAVIGFVAMTSYRIPQEKAGVYVGLFFLSAITNACGDVSYVLPALSFLLYVFPVQVGSSLLDNGNFSLQTSGVFRDYGVTAACLGIVAYLLARNRVAGLLQSGILKKLFFAAALVGCLIGGFRSALVLVLLTCFFMFWFEKLYRTKYVLIPIAALVLCLPLAPFADHLPASIQRTLSVIPFVKVSAEARASAETTSEWRITMWKILLPEVPQYFWLGKGFESNISDYVATLNNRTRGGIGDDSASFRMAGDYHNGPLSVVIPFGIWGVIGFVWLFWAGTRALYLNYRNGPEHLRAINIFLLSNFLARLVMFLAVFGSAYSDLAIFAGILALSISLNGGVLVPAPATAKPSKVPRRDPLLMTPEVARPLRSQP